jgi:tRNA threonylcarbamoyl adenosine modification protein (Sua5/YciO/YrdC/YwlC family)
MTTMWPIGDEPSREQIEEIATTLLAGDIVLLPTDTIYGLHALANDARAVQSIAQLKGRDGEKPFVVIGASLEQLENAGAVLTSYVRSVVAELWPGPLTAVVTLREPIAASRGAKTIAMRVPGLRWLRDLLERTGPLASTSANRSGEPPLSDPEQLSADLHQAIHGVVDGGVREGNASVIVDFSGDEPRLIREGEAFFTQKVWKTLRKSL